MVKWLTIVSVVALTACASKPTPTKVETVYVNVPVVLPVPQSIRQLMSPVRPQLPIDHSTFSTDNNYWKAATEISESFFLLKNYTLQLEKQNETYRTYILSLPEGKQ